jgi:hypothetical protein
MEVSEQRWGVPKVLGRIPGKVNIMTEPSYSVLELAIVESGCKYFINLPLIFTIDLKQGSRVLELARQW